MRMLKIMDGFLKNKNSFIEKDNERLNDRLHVFGVFTNPFTAGALRRRKQLAMKCSLFSWVGIEPPTLWLRDEVSNHNTTSLG